MSEMERFFNVKNSRHVVREMPTVFHLTSVFEFSKQELF